MIFQLEKISFDFDFYHWPMSYLDFVVRKVATNFDFSRGRNWNREIEKGDLIDNESDFCEDLMD